MQVSIRKLNKSVEVDFATLPDESQQYIIAYGLKQTLNDAIASAESTAEGEGLLAKRLDALRDGTMRLRKVAERKDALTQECVRIAKAALKAKLSGKAIGKDEFAELVAKAAQHPNVVAKAKANLAAAMEIELPDLG